MNLVSQVLGIGLNNMKKFKDYTQRETLAALEHEQWSHWTKYMLANMTKENIAKWKKQIDTPYEKLTEKEKDSDREWADKVWSLLHP